MTETAQAPTPTPAPRRLRTRTIALGALGAAGIATSSVFGLQAAADGSTPTAVGMSSSAVAQPAVDALVPGSRAGSRAGGYGSAGGFGGLGYSYGYGSATAPGSTATAATEATSAQLVGVVDVDTVLSYRGAEAAGTGMVLTSDGEVLTNNHVVEGATSITVTVLSTGATYDATVVGTDPTDDVAVLQLTGASGLSTVTISDASAATGDTVTAVGNAGGEVGSTSAATGTVTALDQSITATDESGSNAEQLSGLIETNADVEAGDSGGPLYDASGAVVGMDTAASSSGAPQAYAIPIDNAVAIADQITSGVDSATIHQGYPAFLGVSVTPGRATGAAVAGVVPDGPAASAGLAAGDVITAVGGTAVTSADDLTTALAGHSPGDRVTVTWLGSTGTAHSARVTLAAGPAD